MKNSVLCLFSGGIDSTVMVKHYLDKGWDVHCLFIPHYQSREEEETRSIGNIGHVMDLHLRVSKIHPIEYDKYFGPYRNLLLLSIACNYAYFNGINSKPIRNVAIGLCLGEYLDTRPEFVDRFNFMQEYCLKKPIWILAPFSNWSSDRVIKYGLKIGAPLNLTTSCMETPACGKCLKCKLRKKHGIEVK